MDFDEIFGFGIRDERCTILYCYWSYIVKILFEKSVKITYMALNENFGINTMPSQYKHKQKSKDKEHNGNKTNIC